MGVNTLRGRGDDYKWIGTYTRAVVCGCGGVFPVLK